jgi:hypothetical protein
MDDRACIRLLERRIDQLEELIQLLLPDDYPVEKHADSKLGGAASGLANPRRTKS